MNPVQWIESMGNELEIRIGSDIKDAQSVSYSGIRLVSVQPDAQRDGKRSANVQHEHEIGHQQVIRSRERHQNRDISAIKTREKNRKKTDVDIGLFVSLAVLRSSSAVPQTAASLET